MARVKLFANFREAAGVKEVEVEASSVGELLENLVKKFPKLESLFYEKGRLRDYVNVMVNGRNVRGELNYPLKDDDEVAVFPPVSGG
ncbi:ubiquitin-like small modifier protein 1 [Archaeoglobus sp.]